MIDIHFHCLPGIDDGPRSLEESVALCRAAEAEGTTAIVCTPHVLRDPWINDNPRARGELLMKLNTVLGGSPAVLPGCEYYFSSDAVELWEQGSGPLVGLNRSRYLLVEFPAHHIPRNAEAVFHELALLDVRPVIAHPERNIVFAREPERLRRLVDRGGLCQLTAGSILGEFGKNALSASSRMIDSGLAHVVASDAHSTDRRPPRLAAAYRHARAAFGEEIAERLFVDAPARIIGNLPL